MAQKIVLDVEQVCELSVATKAYHDEVSAQLDNMEKYVSELGELMDGGDDVEGYKEAFQTITTTSTNIRSILDKLYILARNKADMISETYKQKGGTEAAAKLKAQSEKMKART